MLEFRSLGVSEARVSAAGKRVGDHTENLISPETLFESLALYVESFYTPTIWVVCSGTLTAQCTTYYGVLLLDECSFQTAYRGNLTV
ncbi:MAG: hypothetical protein GX456_01645 [Verrucomicrobia bacterium]|nr:hypothetical protein [Verrucomicrobiota bacterium]